MIITVLPRVVAADLVNIYVDNPSSTLAGYVVNDLKITFTGQVTTQELLITLTSGSIYQDAVGSDTPPSSAPISVVPSVAFDSFVTLGSLVASATTPSIAGGAVDIGGGVAKVFGTSAANIAWFPSGGTVITGMSDWPVARLTLSDTAEGTWRFLSTTSTGNGYISAITPTIAGPNVSFSGGSHGTIHGGAMSVPEPSSAALVLIAFILSGFVHLRRVLVKNPAND